MMLFPSLHSLQFALSLLQCQLSCGQANPRISGSVNVIVLPQLRLSCCICEFRLLIYHCERCVHIGGTCICMNRYEESNLLLMCET